MTDKEKLTKIEQFRRDFERNLLAAFGVECTVSVALHDGTQDQTAAAIELGWRSSLLTGLNTISTQAPTKVGIGTTVIYYHPDIPALNAAPAVSARAVPMSHP